MKPALVLSCLLAISPLFRATVVENGGYFPVLVKLQDGDLLAVLRGGAAHLGRGGRLDLIRSRDAGKTWSTPKVLIDGPEDDRNPAMGQLADGTLLISYTVLRYADDASGDPAKASRTSEGVYIMRSADSGRTWSHPVRATGVQEFYSSQGGAGNLGSPYGKIVQLSDGTALMGVYFSFPGERKHESYLFRSRDGGKTWGEPALLGKHFNEAGLLVTRDGRVLAAMRSEIGGYLAVISSSDNGITWSDPMRVTEDNEHPADLIELRGGRVLLTYGERNPPRGVHAILSGDGGRTWDKDKTLVLADDAQSRDSGYPSSVETADDTIVTMYYQVDDPDGKQRGAKAKVVIWNAQ